MKNMPILFILALMSLVITGCVEKSKKSSSTSQQSAYCMQYPYSQGCYGTTTAGTTAGTTGGTTQACFQSTNNYWYMPGCPGYCQNNPTNPGCAGGTTGTTTGGVTGTTTGGTNPYPNYPSNPIYQNWGVQYPGGVPTETCSAPYAPSGINYTPYETRKATMSIAGQTWFNPADSIASQYLNTSSLLRSVAGSKQLFETDSVLKVRFKPRPQPQQTNSNRYCYFPGTISGSTIAGYTKLMYNVTLVGTRANGTVETEPLGGFTTTVNSCTPAIDLSSYASTYPGGIYIRIENVQANQLSFPNDYAQYGFKNEGGFVSVRTRDCWTVDVEVAADGTKTFD